MVDMPPSAGAGGLLEKLGELGGLKGMPPGMTPPAQSPQMPRLGGPPPPLAGPAGPAAAPQGQDLARFFRALFTGAAGVDPTRPKLSAFAQGAGGAMQSRYGEDIKERTLKAAQDRQGFEDTLKIRRDQREESKDKRDDASRGPLNSLREMRSAKIVNDLLKAEGKGLTNMEIIAAKRLIEREASRLADPLRSDVPKEQIDKKLAEYARSVADDLKNKRISVPGAAPAAGGSKPAQRSPPSAGEIRSYQGKQYRFKGGEDVEANWEVVK